GVVQARVGDADVVGHLGEDAVGALRHAVLDAPGDDTHDPVVHDQRAAGVAVAGGGGAGVAAGGGRTGTDHVALDEVTAPGAGTRGVRLDGQRGRLQRLGDLLAGGAG